MARKSSSFAILTAAALLGIVGTLNGQTPAPAPTTLWNFLGIPQGFNKLFDNGINRGGNFPGLERTPPLKSIADPANLQSSNPAIKKAAEIKQEEDLKKQKIKAIKYLASVGCGCYKGVKEALMAALDDCSEEVRYAAASAIGDAATTNCTCAKCGQGCCCDEELSKKLAKVAYERDDKGCWLESSERVREAAKDALRACCPGRGPTQEPTPVPTPAPNGNGPETVPQAPTTAPEFVPPTKKPLESPPPLPTPAPVSSPQVQWPQNSAPAQVQGPSGEIRVDDSAISAPAARSEIQVDPNGSDSNSKGAMLPGPADAVASDSGEPSASRSAQPTVVMAVRSRQPEPFQVGLSADARSLFSTASQQNSSLIARPASHTERTSQSGDFETTAGIQNRTKNQSGRIIRGSIVAVDSQNRTVRISFPAGSHPEVGMMARVNHEYLLGTSEVGTLEIIKLEEGSAIGRPVGDLPIGKLSKDCDVFCQEMAPSE